MRATTKYVVEKRWRTPGMRMRPMGVSKERRRGGKEDKIEYILEELDNWFLLVLSTVSG